MDEIVADGGQAVVNGDDVSSSGGRGAAGRRRPSTPSATSTSWSTTPASSGTGCIVNLSEEDWDAVLAVHLRSTFLTTRTAARHWRERAKAGQENSARVINTSSVSGLFGNIGQSNYGAAKAAIAAFTIIASPGVRPLRHHRQRHLAGGHVPG